MSSGEGSPLRVTAADGIELAGEAFGRPTDPPAVLLHGTGQTRAAWRATARALAHAGWYAAAFDLRGHGESGWSADGCYDTDRMTSDVVRMVDAVGRPAALVGSSFGGRSMLVAAGEAAWPLASALVLLETAARLADDGAARIAAFLCEHLDGFADLDEVADAIARYRGTPRRPTDESRLLQVVRRRDDGRYHWHWDARVVVANGQVVRHRGPSQEARTAAAARAIAAPTLLVRGEHSDLVTTDAAAEFLQLVPHAELATVPGVGHMIAGDDNDHFRDLVVGFLQRARAATT